MKQIGVYLTEKEHRKFKLAVVADGLSMSQVVRDLILGWLERHEESKAGFSTPPATSPPEMAKYA